jgi:diguanylate cyclase (GGDEF)-like protein/PAS domain S-box-containing protein
LREQEEFFHLIAESIDDFIVVLDLEGRRLYASPSYRQFFGATRDLRGTDSFANIHPEDRERVKKVFSETVRSGMGRQIDYRLLLADGRIREMESSGSLIRDTEGRVARVVVVSRDITTRKQMEEQIRQLAFYDPLTNLPNRRLLNDRLNQTMAASMRSACYGALMFLDLDNFKSLNDAHGHAVGDLLLVEVADRLKSCVREMDTVARFGGDEFVVMISELDVDKSESTLQAGLIAEKIRIALAQPYRLTIERAGVADTTIEHPCTTSIGVTLFIHHEASQEDILKWADKAMYQAKEDGCNLIRFYE